MTNYSKVWWIKGHLFCYAANQSLCITCLCTYLLPFCLCHQNHHLALGSGIYLIKISVVDVETQLTNSVLFLHSKVKQSIPCQLGEHLWWWSPMVFIGTSSGQSSNDSSRKDSNLSLWNSWLLQDNVSKNTTPNTKGSHSSKGSWQETRALWFRWCGRARISWRLFVSESSPGTIRGDFGIVIERNIFHGSDSIVSAEREIKLWFASEELIEWTPCQNSWINE